MAKTDEEIHSECMQRFIDLANGMKDDGIETRVISAGLMTASAIYATYVLAGNEGRLPSGDAENLVLAYRDQLEHVQQARQESRKQS